MTKKIHNLSLQGVTGIIFGLVSVLFTYAIFFLISQFTTASQGVSLLPISFFEIIIALISLLYIVISYLTVVLINKRRRKIINLKGWDLNSKKIVRIFLFLLIIGGILGYLFLKNGFLKFIIPAVLILFGLGCILVKKQTIGDSKILGGFFILQGLLTYFNPNLMFYIFGISFGGFHIIYGMLYYLKRR